MKEKVINFGAKDLTIEVHSSIVKPQITIEGSPFVFSDGGIPIRKNTKLVITNEKFTDYSLSYHNPMSSKPYYELVIFFRLVTVVIYSQYEGELLQIIDKHFKY